MHRDSEHIPELVAAARAGDAEARERLAADHLPLVYNIVGRALDGHADVDDVVQDTMFQALDNLGGLREPSRFRSWLVAIAMNRIRRRWTDRQQAPVAPLERVADAADPGGDFVDLTILRLGLSGQRREVAEATRWLDEADRGLLALWWQEAAGELTRAELAEALGLTPQHAAVRIQRMKAQLEVGRVVVRALASGRRCGGLAALTAPWDGRPEAVWRKRIARHARSCAVCRGHGTDLVPPERLLAGLALVVPLYGLNAVGYGEFGIAAAASTAAEAGPVPVPGGAGSTGPESGSGSVGPASGGSSGAATGAGARRAVVAVAGTVAVGVLLALLWPTPVSPSPSPGAGVPITAPPPVTETVPGTDPVASPTPSPSPTLTEPSAKPAPARRPSTTTRAPAPASTPEQRVTELVNARRAEAGCAPLRVDPRLSSAARRHAQDMAARGYFDHRSPEGQQADARMSAAGYDWSAWAENLHRGPRDPAAVVEGWMDGSLHQENMLACQYRDTGVAAVPGPDGRMVWVQNLARPS
ncbi:sigma-70 family RNA polymerase sigma factor [Streptomyces sp. NPDC006368]|uniref:sigma-70 family RNA polymerase sigma factor n=1 Tax=Streptomyces sp. NPDC006368 TaxID=3156760 RepID=UPI0033B44876